MLTIIDKRETGKAKKLLTSARNHNAIVITQNKRAFEVKAKNLGFDDIEIIDYNDLENMNYDLLKPVLIHNADKMLKWLMQQNYHLDVLGFTATVSENKANKTTK